MPQYFTKEGLQKLKEELKDLKGPQMRRIVKLIAEAASFGDLKENSAYHEARNSKSFLLGRIEQLEQAINDAVIREKSGEDKIQLGSKVEMLFAGKKESYEIVSPTEADILKNKISYQSPFGQKLMNKKEGEEFDFQAGAKKVKVKVLSID